MQSSECYICKLAACSHFSLLNLTRQYGANITPRYMKIFSQYTVGITKSRFAKEVRAKWPFKDFWIFYFLISLSTKGYFIKIYCNIKYCSSKNRMTLTLTFGTEPMFIIITSNAIIQSSKPFCYMVVCKYQCCTVSFIIKLINKLIKLKQADVKNVVLFSARGNTRNEIIILSSYQIITDLKSRLYSRSDAFSLYEGLRMSENRLLFKKRSAYENACLFLQLFE